MYTPSPRQRRTLGWTAAAGLLGVALLHLVVRGPIDHKGAVNLCDFATHWAGARVWLTGGNPYDSSILYDRWINGRGAFETYHDLWVSLLPPGAFALLSPIAALPPGAASIAWLALSVACIGAMIWATMQLAGMRAASLGGFIFIAGALASAPVQTLLAVGQASLPVIALVFLAFVATQRRYDLLAGAMLGAAATLKPQLAGPFFLWFLFFARWRVLGTAIAACLLLNLIAIVPMHASGHAWWADWNRNIDLSTSPGGPNDPTSAGPWRNQMIDLRVWLFTLLDEEQLVTATGLLASMLLAAAYVALLCRVRTDDDPGDRDAQRERFLAFATLAALALLPVYHKSYDAALLLPAFAWALLSLRSPRTRAFAVATLLGLTPLLVPFDFLPLIMKRTDKLDALSQTWFWHVLIYPHHALGTIVTSLCMLLAFWHAVRARRAEAAVGAREPEPEPQALPGLAASRS